MITVYNVFFRPHVVTADWLVECFKKRNQVSEDDYYYMDFAPTDAPPTVKKKTSVGRQVTQEDNTITEPPAQPVEQEAMQDIMSQYLPQQTAGMLQIKTFDFKLCRWVIALPVICLYGLELLFIF